MRLHYAQGHRERLRERIETLGLDATGQRDVLETLLSFAIPRKDVRTQANDLLHRYGTLHNVLRADAKSLTETRGIGSRVAFFLNFVYEIHPYALRSSLDKEFRVISTFTKAVEFVKGLLVSQECEWLYVICLDLNSRVIGTPERFKGVTLGAQMYNNIDVLSYILRLRPNRVILAHNHVNEIAVPSHQDYEFTFELAKLLTSFGMYLTDHIIVTKEGDYFSMAASNKLPRMQLD